MRHFDNGGRGHEIRNEGSFQKLGRVRKLLPVEVPEGAQACWHLNFNPKKRISGFCKSIHLCGFKLLNVWSFVTAAVGSEYDPYFLMIPEYSNLVLICFMSSRITGN